MVLNKFILSFVLLLSLSIVNIDPGVAQTEQAEQTKSDQKIEVKVDGMSCMFCAYSLESKFNDLEFIKDLEIKVTDGLMTFTLLNGHELTDEAIRERVEDAGFTPREITRSPAG